MFFLYLLLEPFHGFVLGDSVAESNTTLPSAFVAHTVAWSAEHDVEVHAVDTDSRVVLDAKIDVFLDTKAKVPSFGEISLSQFVFTNLLTTSNY